MVEAQRSAAQEERRQRVERIKSETTDTVTRNAKKGYVDERWDVADTMREQMETWRAQRKAQELAYLESALAINAATSMEPAREAKEKARATKLAATAQLRERKKIIKEQQATDGSSITQAKSAIHDSIHGLKFVPDEEVRTHSSMIAHAHISSLFFSHAYPLCYDARRSSRSQSRTRTASRPSLRRARPRARAARAPTRYRSDEEMRR